MQKFNATFNDSSTNIHDYTMFFFSPDMVQVSFPASNRIPNIIFLASVHKLFARLPTFIHCHIPNKSSHDVGIRIGNDSHPREPTLYILFKDNNSLSLYICIYSLLGLIFNSRYFYASFSNFVLHGISHHSILLAGKYIAQCW